MCSMVIAEGLVKVRALYFDGERTVSLIGEWHCNEFQKLFWIIRTIWSIMIKNDRNKCIRG